MSQKVKTMRDIWDKESKEKPEVKKYKIFPPEIEKYYFDYLVRKRAVIEIKEEIIKVFADYKGRLGEAGFSKITS